MHYIVTLAERSYLLGVAALYNSLISNGFNGRLVVGFENSEYFPKLPYLHLQAEGNKVVWMKLNTKMHFANYKPTLMLDVLREFGDCEKVTYIDPDIVLHAPFSWLNSWCDGGPVVCSDVNWWMPADHPTRREWQQLTGLPIHHRLDLFFNSGFVSLRREDREFASLWENLIIQYGSLNVPLDVKGEIGDWRIGGRWLPLFSPDQDTFNMAISHWDGPITTFGPDAMGFNGPPILAHAIGGAKPWERNFLLYALKGIPPRVVDKIYWRYASKPIMTVTEFNLMLIKLSLSLASLLGRFYRRN